MIYLDYNATAPLRPEVSAAMLEVLGEPLNASSIHGQGRRARKLIEDSRLAILRAVNGDELIFCGGATEANNLALAQKPEARSRKSEIIISAIEHDSIFKAAPEAKKIEVDQNGVINLASLERILASGFRFLVSVMLANNETGVIQPVKETAALVHEYGGLMHCDAVQGLCKLDVDFKDLGADMLTISPHKIGGPVGIGALVYKKGLNIKACTKGGGQEKNLRAGTENVAAIVGFGAAVQSPTKNVPRETSSKLDRLMRDLGNKIKGLGGIIVGDEVERLPNTSCIIMPGVPAATQIMHFDLNRIMVSSGSACSSGKVEVSRVLKAMGVQNADCAIRVSGGWGTTEAELESFVEVWKELFKRLAS